MIRVHRSYSSSNPSSILTAHCEEERALCVECLPGFQTWTEAEVNRMLLHVGAGQSAGGGLEVIQVPLLV